MINNKDLITPLLNFEKEGDFYMLYVLKRKKDQPEGQRDNHQSVRTIKTYSVSSVEYLEKRWDEIVGLCEFFKARAYIHVQKQNHFDVSLNMMVELATRIQNKVHDQRGLFDSVVGGLKTYEKRWIIDIDTKEVSDNLLDCLFYCEPVGKKIEARIPTKNGWHLITSKFNILEFKKEYPDVDIQKKNPTLLYYPLSLQNQNLIQ